MSTFIVEVDAGHLRARRLRPRCRTDEARAACERVFADVLDGHPLISNNSVWRQFPDGAQRALVARPLRAARRCAAHCAFLDRLGHAAGDGGCHRARRRARASSRNAVGDALADYEARRRPILEKLVAAANASGHWYEHFAEHMRLAPIDFAMSYLTRSGRIDMERLRRLSPGFAARYERERPGSVRLTSTPPSSLRAAARWPCWRPFRGCLSAREPSATVRPCARSAPSGCG